MADMGKENAGDVRTKRGRGKAGGGSKSKRLRSKAGGGGGGGVPVAACELEFTLKTLRNVKVRKLTPSCAHRLPSSVTWSSSR